MRVKRAVSEIMSAELCLEKSTAICGAKTMPRITVIVVARLTRLRVLKKTKP
jgi:hypothetical protein